MRRAEQRKPPQSSTPLLPGNQSLRPYLNERENQVVLLEQTVVARQRLPPSPLFHFPVDLRAPPPGNKPVTNWFPRRRILAVASHCFPFESSISGICFPFQASQSTLRGHLTGRVDSTCNGDWNGDGPIITRNPARTRRLGSDSRSVVAFEGPSSMESTQLLPEATAFVARSSRTLNDSEAQSRGVETP